ncbi:hypothetical protein ACJX0J_035766, partial [Zea mays]
APFARILLWCLLGSHEKSDMLRRWTSDTMGNGCNCKENRLTSHQWSATRSINTTQGPQKPL